MKTEKNLVEDMGKKNEVEMPASNRRFGASGETQRTMK